MKTVIWHIWIRITMVGSRNISGLQFRLQSMERLQKKRRNSAGHYYWGKGR